MLASLHNEIKPNLHLPTWLRVAWLLCYAVDVQSQTFRYSLVFLLAMTEIMPVMLLGQTLPILLRRGGASMDEVGLLYLVMSPWAFKFLWAPLVDRLGSQTHGKYRSWLLWVHPLLILFVMVLSLVNLPVLLFTHRSAAFAMLALLTVICATADTAADGLAIGLLSPGERGTGNGYQMAGTMMGNLVGGGLLLISLDVLGWQTSCWLLALLLLVPYVGVLLYREPSRTPRPPLTTREILSIFQTTPMKRWIILVICIEGSYAMAYTPMQALLSDKGFSLEEVGLMMGVLSSIAGALGGALGAWAIGRYGRRWSFFSFAAFTALAIASMSLATPLESPRWVVYLTIEASVFGLMSLGTVMYTMMMDRTRPDTASSDYTTQYCALQLASFSAMALGGFLAEAAGSSTVFLLTPILMTLVFGTAAYLLRPVDFSLQPLDTQ